MSNQPTDHRIVAQVALALLNRRDGAIDYSGPLEIESPKADKVLPVDGSDRPAWSSADCEVFLRRRPLRPSARAKHQCLRAAECEIRVDRPSDE